MDCESSLLHACARVSSGRHLEKLLSQRLCLQVHRAARPHCSPRCCQARPGAPCSSPCTRSPTVSSFPGVRWSHHLFALCPSSVLTSHSAPSWVSYKLVISAAGSSSARSGAPLPKKVAACVHEAMLEKQRAVPSLPAGPQSSAGTQLQPPGPGFTEEGPSTLQPGRCRNPCGLMGEGCPAWGRRRLGLCWAG